MSLKPSDLSSKVTVPAGLTPANDNSEYPTHYSAFGHGGLRTVNTITERDALPSDRRVNGMLAFVVADSKYYQLQSDLTTWVEFTTSASGEIGRLQIIVTNNTGATLTGNRAYSLEENTYTVSTNTCVLTATNPGTITDGQTGIFWLETDLANGATGVGVIKGILETTTITSVDSEIDFKILITGTLGNIIASGEYIVATLLRSPSGTNPVEFAFDGLSSIRFGSSGGSGHIIENGAGTDLTQRANLQFVGATVTDDAANDRTVVEVTQGERIVIGEDQFKVETNAGDVLPIPRNEAGSIGDAISQTYKSSSQGINVGVKYSIASSSPTLTIFNLLTGELVPGPTVSSPNDCKIVGETGYFTEGSTIRTFTVGQTTSTAAYTPASGQPIVGGAIVVIGTTIYFGAASGLARVDTSTTGTVIDGISTVFQRLTTNGTLIFGSVFRHDLRVLNPGDSTPSFTIITAINNASQAGQEYQPNSLGDELFYRTNDNSNPFGIYTISTNTISTQTNPLNLSSLPATSGNSGWGKFTNGVAYNSGNNSNSLAIFSTVLTYTQTIALPNVTTNTDTAKYVYENPFASVGTFNVAFNDPTPTAITTAALTLELNNTPAFPTAGTVRFSVTGGVNVISFNATDLPNLFNEDSIITLKTGVTGRVNFGIQGSIYVFTFITGSITDLTNGETLTITGFSGSQVPASNEIRIGINSQSQEFLGFNSSVRLLDVGDMIRLKSNVVATITTVSALIAGAIYYVVTYDSGSRASFTDGEMIDVEFPNSGFSQTLSYNFSNAGTFTPASGEFTQQLSGTSLVLTFNNIDSNGTDQSSALTAITGNELIRLGTDTILNVVGINTQVSGSTLIIYTVEELGSFDFNTSQTLPAINYGPEVGTLEIIDEQHYDHNFDITVQNNAAYTGGGYRLFLDIDGVEAGLITDQFVSGTTQYTVTIPTSIHRGNDLRIREFVPDATAINAIVTNWAAGSSWAVDEANVSGLQTAKVTIPISSVSSGVASITHNLNNNYLTVWEVRNGITANTRQVVNSTFTITNLNTIEVSNIATSGASSITFLIQGF